VIVNEYYITNFTKSIPLDFLFIFIYFTFAGIFMRIFNLKSIISKLFTIAIITFLVTGFFYIYFTSYEETDTFFSRWFHTVGYSSIIYDVILLTFIYLIFLYYKNKLNYYN
jgi:hypothetical protein